MYLTPYVLCSPTTPEARNEACQGLWLTDVVTIHSRKWIFFSRYQLQIAFGLGVGLHVHFSFCELFLIWIAMLYGCDGTSHLNLLSKWL